MNDTEMKKGFEGFLNVLAKANPQDQAAYEVAYQMVLEGLKKQGKDLDTVIEEALVFTRKWGNWDKDMKGFNKAGFNIFIKFCNDYHRKMFENSTDKVKKLLTEEQATSALKVPSDLDDFEKMDGDSYYKELARYSKYCDMDDHMDEYQIDALRDKDYTAAIRKYKGRLDDVNDTLKKAGYKPNAYFDLGEKGHFCINFDLVPAKATALRSSEVSFKEGDKVEHPKHGIGFFNKLFEMGDKLVALVKFKARKYGHLEMGTPVSPDELKYMSSVASTSKSGILDPFQKEMNPKIWDTSGEEPKIKDDLKEKVFEKIKLFTDKYGIEPFGLTFYGGNAGYQYGDGSDIDLGIYIEWPEEKVPMYKDMLDFCRGELSFDHEGIEVHFFLKDPVEKEAVEANENVYEILNDTWIQKPKKFDVDPKEELAPFIEKGNVLVQKMQITFDKLMSDLKNLKSMDVEEVPKSYLEVFQPLVKVVKQLRVNRNIEHKNLRKKAVDGEEITFFDRATQNEVAWKLLTETKMLGKLDEIKDILE